MKLNNLFNLVFDAFLSKALLDCLLTRFQGYTIGTHCVQKTLQETLFLLFNQLCYYL